MRKSYRNWVIWGSAALVCGGLLSAAMERVLAREDKAANQPPEVVVDARPPDRASGLVASYAPVLKKAAPAVVNIYTTKTIRSPQFQQGNPFFDDPAFRRFFGDRFDQRAPRAPRSYEQRSLGSGVVVTSDGYILTNDHVVDGADEVMVKFEESGKEQKAEIVGRDPQTDIAVLKIEADDLPHAVFADSDHVEVGDVVLALGNPFGIGQTVTMGIVSAVGRGGMGIEDYEDFIQTDAAINPGNSGGALVDAQGRLIGVNTAILSQSGGNHGVGFAIPANLVRSVLDQLVASGEVRRGFLGVAPQDLTPELAREFGLEDKQGALIAEVTKDSAAESAGVKRGDVVVALNGKAVRGARSLRVMIGQLMPGTDIELKIIRDGRERTLKASLKSVPGSEQASGRQGRNSKQGAGDEGALSSVGVADLTPALRRQYSIPEEVEGVVITGLDPESASYKAGLREGDIILEINRGRVRTAEEAVEACDQSRDGTTLVNFWRGGGHRYVVVKENDSE